MFNKIYFLFFLLIVSTGSILAQSINPGTDTATTVTDDTLVIPTIAIENDNVSLDDDGVSLQNSGNMVVTTNDIFISTASYVFLNGYFQPRGYGRNSRDVLVNGVSVNDGETGNAAWGQFGGLNDVFRSRNVTWGLNPSEHTFGNIGGSNYVEATAADQRKEIRVSHLLSDRLYNDRLMFTYNTGVMKNGWAFSFSGNKRWAQTEQYYPGRFYDGYSYYAAASKHLGKGTLNLTTYGSPTKLAKGGSATMENYQLAGNNYFNQYWGYQDGKVRSSRIQNTFQPVTILNYDCKPNEKTRWNTAIALETGKDKTSFIDYYNAPSPYGNYYKNLPSYFLTFVPPDTFTANTLKNQILQNRDLLQINWNNLYNANYLNIQTLNNVNGISGKSFTGKQSSYVLSNDVTDVKKYSFNTSFEHSVNLNLSYMGGLSVVDQHTEKYEQLADLLGGDYFVNFNQFASQQYVGNINYFQNNLNNPNQVIKTGDKYGYDYSINVFNVAAWGQAVYNYKKFGAFFAASLGQDGFDRDGYMRNGLFANHSYGTSSMHSFFDYAVKGGVNYGFDNHNYIFANVAYITSPPTVDNTYISAGTRDYAVNAPTTQNTSSLEGGYELRERKLHVKILGYVTDVKDATEIKRFFNDDPAYYTFVNYVMQGENTRSIGTETYIDYKFSRSLHVIGVAAIGQAFYTNRPTINVYLDNDTLQHPNPDKAYINNYYISAGPQTALRLGFEYWPKYVKGLNVALNFNYYDRNYVEVNPNRRTEAATDLLTPGTPLWHQIYDQQKLPSAFMADLRASKVFHLNNLLSSSSYFSRSNLSISANVSNLFDNRNVINFGYEQLRFDFTNKNPAKFANKYIYGLGTNYSINIALTLP